MFFIEKNALMDINPLNQKALSPLNPKLNTYR